MQMNDNHSAEAQNLVIKFVERLQSISDGRAESFPFVLVDELKKDYGIK